ncbi:MAG TPA: hypothetical protein VGK00_18515 [Anaerolineales bacterium]|jgi:hypothetical protein
MSILLIIHSITRWLVVFVALALVGRLLLGLINSRPFDKSAGVLVAAFGGLMDVQMLLGLLLFLLGGFGGLGFPAYRWEHAVLMLLAVIMAHVPAWWKKSPDEVRTRNTLIMVILSLVLVFLGVGPLGWTRWLHITGLF